MSTIKVFISYSHDSDEHRQRVLGLSERLRDDGIETIVDQYISGTPPEGWPRWMLDQLDAAQYVLVVCTESYYRRFRGHEVPGKGKGVDWEGALITQELYDSPSRALKFVPIFLSEAVEGWIPEPLRKVTHYALTSEEQYSNLYDFLLQQSGVEPRPVGTLKTKPRQKGTAITFPAAGIQARPVDRADCVNQPPPPRHGRIRWLHLSDLHFRDQELWEHRATLEALRRAIGEHQLRPDLVFVTGDIAFSGKAAEYELAESFFSRLAEDLELDPRERFFIVPGNHDVDQSQIKPSERRILTALASEQDVSEVLSDPDTLRLVTRRLQSFCAFTQRLLGPARGFYPEKLTRTDVIDINGVLVGVLGLNSAWTATGTSADKGRLLVGAETVQNALAEIEDALFRVALMHHCTADLQDFDQEQVDSLLGSPRGAAFLLRGHRHKTKPLVHSSPSAQLQELAAGTAYVEGEWPKGFLFGDLDLAAGKGKVHFFAYSDNSGGYWHPDNSAYKECNDGIWAFDLPEHLRIGNPNEQAAEAPLPISAARQRNLAERYRDAAAAVHGTLRLIGVAARSDRPNVTTPAMFVPLKFEIDRLIAEHPVDHQGNWNMAQLIQALTPRLESDDAPSAGAHIVMLGDPGSGKTTLCRYLTAVLAKGADGVPALSEGALPLFLPFRDYVVTARNRPDLSLIEYLELQSKRDLSVKFPEGFLEERLENGEAVLLLDGLDEVGQASGRATMRDRVLGFCESYPKVPVLVTSRITGYGDAPLPALFNGYFNKVHKNGAVESQVVVGGGFEQLRVAPFDDPALDAFVQRWYELMEPENPSVRSERIGELLAALEAEPRVKELARNPLLATLIALIHRSEAHLPGERAELYERCVQTLIIDWPAARRGTFKEIDEGLQRRYLEQLALEMQRKRTGQDKEVVIERKDMERALLRGIQQHHDPILSETLTRRWVDYLEKGTGLLVEQRPGVFGFLHLSLLEFLSACAWERELGNAPEFAQTVAEHCMKTEWREVCLLSVGRHATDTKFLDTMFAALPKEPLENWIFLLDCMRDEAAFRADQREAVLDGAGQFVLNATRRLASEAWVPLRVILRFSRRHREAVQFWWKQQLAHATEDSLLSALVLSIGNSDEAIESLRQRPDHPLVASALLELFPDPSNYVPYWAIEVIARDAAFDWCWHKCPEDSLIVRALAANQRLDAGFLCVFLLAALTRLAVHATEVVKVDAATLRLFPANAMGDGGAIRCQTDDVATAIVPKRWPKRTALARTAGPGVVSRPFASDCLIRGFEHLPVQSPSDPNAKHSFTFIEPQFASKFSVILKHVSFRVLAHAHGAKQWLKESTLNMRNFEHEALFGFDEILQSLGANSQRQIAGAPLNLESPDSNQPSLSKSQRRFRSGDSSDRRLEPEPRATECEALIGLAVSIGQPDSTRMRCIVHRIQSRCINLSWELIDFVLANLSDPTSLALYLSLGWPQATVTYEWPDSEKWRELFKSPPPEHWLPRLYFELCWLTYNRNLRDHYDAFFDALNRGLQDPEFSIVAEKLKELFPAYEVTH